MRSPFLRLASPSFLIRQNALYKGVFGPSRGWKLVAVVIFGSGLFKRLFGKRPDHLGVEKLRAGQTICITSIAPSTRSERRVARRRSS